MLFTPACRVPSSTHSICRIASVHLFKIRPAKMRYVYKNGNARFSCRFVFRMSCHVYTHIVPCMQQSFRANLVTRIAAELPGRVGQLDRACIDAHQMLREHACEARQEDLCAHVPATKQASGQRGCRHGPQQLQLGREVFRS